jgi:hypothetical protein
MANDSVDVETLKRLLRDDVPLEDGARVLGGLCSHLIDSGLDDNVVRDLAIRLLGAREQIEDGGGVVDSVARQLGLFPYLDPRHLSTAELIAYEAHRPLGSLGDTIVFHAAQNDIYQRLMDGRNVILSAPTSFGKSLIVDALLTSGRYNNVFLVVPTLALIDETRQRVAALNTPHRVITHASQSQGQANVFIMTQERVLEIVELPERVDLLVIDEFYKLDAHEDRDRGELLNQAMYRLFKTGAQMYFLGPNIDAIPEDLPFSADFVRTDFNTVAIDVIRVQADKGQHEEALVQLVNQHRHEPTLVYVRSPARARQIAHALIEGVQPADLDGVVASAVEWLSSNFHPEWYVSRGLGQGIGVHHGRLPRSIGQFMVRAFNEGRINVLICTSTLIEGVNTAAKNVVIFDNTVAQQKFDYFTFNNIRGRSGRMFKHFLGRVFLFHDPPPPRLPIVDFPIFTQPDDASLGLLVQLDDDDLNDDSAERLHDVFEQRDLSIDSIRSVKGGDPDRLIALARALRSSPSTRGAVSWTFQPNYEQLVVLCTLAWEYLLGPKPGNSAVRSPKQLAFLINRLRSSPSVRDFIQDRVGDSTKPDEAVENAMEFLRSWIGHRMVRAIWALDAVQSEVLPAVGQRPGSYGLFAHALENLFAPAPLVALEEYGIPLQVSEKIERLLMPDGDLEEVLRRLRALDVRNTPSLHPFERYVLMTAQDSLPRQYDDVDN